MMSQTPTDLKVLWNVLEALPVAAPIRFLEIGVFGGMTARMVHDWCDKRGRVLDYWGIDNKSHPNFKDGMPLAASFAGMKLVTGDSAEVFMQVPDVFDAVLVDGCHCFNHVVLDTLHYGRKVRIGGFIMFHDTSEHIQHTMRDPHGPDHKLFYNSVNEAHAQMGFPTKEWSYWSQSHDFAHDFGGLRVYERIK